MTIISDGVARTITPTRLENICGEWFIVPSLVVYQAI